MNRGAIRAFAANGGDEIRIASATGTAATPQRVISETAESRLEPIGWSADESALIVAIRSADRPGVRIVLTSLAGGAVRDRHTFNEGAARLLLSPDALQIAVEIEGPTPATRSLVTLPVAPGASLPNAIDLKGGRLVGWSPDSAHVVFYRAAPSKMTLHAVDARSGRRQRIVDTTTEDGRTDRFTPIGLTDNGRLYYWLHSATTSRASVWVLNGVVPSPASK